MLLLEVNRERLFTFLRYDAVPWNNNNAEHAIKSFARLRDIMAGSSTPISPATDVENLAICTPRCAAQCRSDPVSGQSLRKTGIIQ